MNEVRIYETATHVFELTISPGFDVPDAPRRRLSLTLLSGEPLTDQDWQRVRE